MTIYEKLGKNIMYHVSLLSNNNDFKKEYPNIDVLEYLSEQSDIKIKRLKNIISGTAKTRIYELYKVAVVLGIEISDLVTEDIVKSKNEWRL